MAAAHVAAIHTRKLRLPERDWLTSFAAQTTTGYSFSSGASIDGAAITGKQIMISGAKTGGTSMGGDSVDRLLDIILQMKINMAHINDALQQQTFEICRELTGVFVGQKKSLDDSLNAIDAKLQECSAHIDDYRRLYASLAQVQTKLVQLGAATSCLPAPLPSESTESVLLWRVNELKEQGRL
jgi:hypothetical protein